MLWPLLEAILYSLSSELLSDMLLRNSTIACVLYMKYEPIRRWYIPSFHALFTLSMQENTRPSQIRTLSVDKEINQLILVLEEFLICDMVI